MVAKSREGGTITARVSDPTPRTDAQQRARPTTIIPGNEKCDGQSERDARRSPGNRMSDSPRDDYDVATPHGSPSWQRGDHGRSALERINNRIDNSFGFERHFIRGRAKMTCRVGVALAIMMARALGHVITRSHRTDALTGSADPRHRLTFPLDRCRSGRYSVACGGGCPCMCVFESCSHLPGRARRGVPATARKRPLTGLVGCPRRPVGSAKKAAAQVSPRTRP